MSLIYIYIYVCVLYHRESGMCPTYKYKMHITYAVELPAALQLNIGLITSPTFIRLNQQTTSPFLFPCCTGEEEDAIFI